MDAANAGAVAAPAPVPAPGRTAPPAPSPAAGRAAAGPAPRGDADLTVIGALLAEPARARVLLALADGRRLPASHLAAEAGVAASTVSGHLRRLLAAGLVSVEAHGRYRYYRLAGPQVADLIEAVARLSPQRPVTSLREGTRAHAVRRARRCYDHLAGRLGVALTGVFLERGWLAGHDGGVAPDRVTGARPAGRVLDPVAYVLTAAGAGVLRELGGTPPRNRAVRCCVDWTEQAHHMAGAAGRVLLERFQHHGWLRLSATSRALTVTDAGRERLDADFGLPPDRYDGPPRPPR